MQIDNNLIQKVIGYILLLPALTSVLLFFAELFSADSPLTYHLHLIWTGGYTGNGGVGFTPVLPFYFGLMAIAGAYLIKDSKK